MLGFISSGFGFFLLMEKVQSCKFEVDKFNGKNRFALWKLKMWDLLVQQGLKKALAGKSKKPASMKDKDWEDLDARALNTIFLCLVDEVLFNIVEEMTTTGLWTKLESRKFDDCDGEMVNISHAVGVVSRHMAKPCEEHGNGCFSILEAHKHKYHLQWLQ